MSNTIFIGNGLNRLNPANTSWENLLKSISQKKELVDKLPNTLQYEDIYLGGDIKHVKEKEFYKETTEYQLKEKIANTFSDYKSNAIYTDMLNLPIEHIITTNYDHVIDQTLMELKFTTDKEGTDHSEDIYSIHRYRGYINESLDRKCIWSIHGDIDAPRSIMLGYDHYCGQTARYNSYIKGSYEFNNTKVEAIKDGSSDE